MALSVLFISFIAFSSICLYCSKSSKYFAFLIFKFAIFSPPLNISCAKPAIKKAKDDSHEKKFPAPAVSKTRKPVILKLGKNSFFATVMSIFELLNLFSISITSGLEYIKSELIISGIGSLY